LSYDKYKTVKPLLTNGRHCLFIIILILKFDKLMSESLHFLKTRQNFYNSI